MTHRGIRAMAGGAEKFASRRICVLLKRECERKVIHRYVLYMSFMGDRISSDQVAKLSSKLERKVLYKIYELAKLFIKDSLKIF